MKHGGMKDLKRLSTNNNDFLCYLVRDPSLALRMTKPLSDSAPGMQTYNDNPTAEEVDKYTDSHMFLTFSVSDIS